MPQEDTKGKEGSSAPPPIPSINLPRGGGAIRGIGEKFSANAVTGTASLSVPIATSPGRSGFGPQLTVSYDSGTGNGPFGIGWSLAIPAITRRTDKGIPQYRDEEESDVFLLAGAEDLVPVLDEGGRRYQDRTSVPGYTIHRYRPRVEGLFYRIERWTRIDGDVHWRTFTRDNVLNIFGLDGTSRIADPADPDHVFSWLVCRSFDGKGNAIVYDYVAENDDGVDLSRPEEGGRSRSANRYLKRILYGNREPIFAQPDLAGGGGFDPQVDGSANWMFEVILDYGEGHYREQPPDSEGRIFSVVAAVPAGPWPVRKDPFSLFRSGFEIRSYRLCRRILMFLHFPDELGIDGCLVRSTAFHYQEKPLGSFLQKVVQSGHALQKDGSYLTRTLPSLDYAYTESPLEDEHFQDFRLQAVDDPNAANLFARIGSGSYRFLDLDGEGISGVLSEQEGSWFYLPNLGNGRFGGVETVRERPAIAALHGGKQMLMDVGGDGNLDLVDLSPPLAGFQERTLDSAWDGFRAFPSLPVRNWEDPNLRFVDVSGDGSADVLVTEADSLLFHPSLLEKGYGEGISVPVPVEERCGPRIVFADPEHSIYLADMTGDGLSDLLRIRNGEICYWPNLGYGRFGARITMANAPRFDTPDVFDQQRVRLADTDGSGTADIVYLAADGIRIYLNQSGNGWSDARRIAQFPAVCDLGSISVTDFLGRGTACLVWSSPLPLQAGRQLCYLDLMCGRKPHLLTTFVNNLGAETRIEYASSTELYLTDKAAGTPWVTRLPFPVHVVQRVEKFDAVSRNRLVTRYAYHHGFYDGVEREFRGFGRVDRYDTEEFQLLTQNGAFPAGENVNATTYLPPVLTKSWYHTGCYPRGETVSRHLAHEYYREPLPQEELRSLLLDDTILPAGLTPEEAREACRSLKGSLLRQEIYALDDKEESSRPYAVNENSFTIRTLQRRWENRHAVFFTHAREALTFNYERKLYCIEDGLRADPRVSHGVTLEVDDYGDVLKSVLIGYGRRFPDSSPFLTDEDRKKQARMLMTLTENRYTNAVDEAGAYRTPLPAESRQYELINLQPSAYHPGVTNLFRFDELKEQVAASQSAPELPFEDWEATMAVPKQPCRRLLMESRTLYRSDKLDRLLPVGALESQALPGESYKLALTPGLLQKIYRGAEELLADPPEILGGRGADGGGYVDLDGDGRWWMPGGRIFFHPDPAAGTEAELARATAHFYLHRRIEDPFGHGSSVDYDRHDLLPTRTVDAVGNTVRAESDYRVLQPKTITDPNGNRSHAIFDALGLLAGTALSGKAEGTPEGDSLEFFEADLSPAAIRKFFEVTEPHPLAVQMLGTATARIVYDLERVPSCSASMGREMHVSDLAPGEQSKVQVRYSYSDGFGREAQAKVQAEPGRLDPSDAASPIASPRWTGTGTKIYNNKGKPVRQYEPFFSASPQFGIEKWGVSPTLFYDPLGRVVATLHPNHSYDKVIFDPWMQSTWDVNDTVTLDPRNDADVGEFFVRLPEADYLPTWYQERMTGAKGAEEKTAAMKAAQHAGTPTVSYFDSIGRAFLTLADNGKGAAGKEFRMRTVSVLDVEGNQRAVLDALDRTVMRYDFDMLAGHIHQASMEAGELWVVNDAAGKPIRTFDSRQHLFRNEYDEMRRPTLSFLRGNRGPEQLIGRMVYGEKHPSPELHNVRGKIVQVFDQAGVVTSEEYDFKGNLLGGRRQLAREYKGTLDWQKAPELEAETFTSSTSYDALNRPRTVSTPDRSVVHPTYNEANLLARIGVNLHGGEEVTTFVSNIEYDAKGQRLLIEYGNGAATTYVYDPFTFRLARLTTRRESGRDGLASQLFRKVEKVQDLHYTYDPAGNLTRIEDRALPTVFFANRQVDPAADYTYDAMYRLVEAQGRESIAQSALQAGGPQSTYRDYPFAGLGAHPFDPKAVRNYTERYLYDAVGNFLQVIHQAEKGAWIRGYRYEETSLIEAEKTSNRLSASILHPNGSHPVLENYGYDPHGNTTSMPHLPMMRWDFKDRLQASSRQTVKEGTPETTWYVYDAAGQRVRKITERQNGTRKNERIYLGSFELYREFKGNENSVTLERETLQVLDVKKRIALVETRTQGEDNSPPLLVRYQFGNHIGSTSLELDDKGDLISYEEYSPYGNSTFQAGRSRAEVKLKRYRFTGKERDEETGFTYHGARYCAPWLGNWVSCDPSGLNGGINLYRYASSNPVGYVDPGGTDDLPSWYRTDEQLTGIKAEIGAIETLLNLTSMCYASDQSGLPENALIAEGISLDPKEASLMAHHLGDLRFLVKINERFGAEAAAKAKWEDEHNWLDKMVTSYEQEKAYWAEKEKHRDWEVKSNFFLDMTDMIVGATPEVSGKLWLLFAGGLGTAPKPGGTGGGGPKPPAPTPSPVPIVSEAALRVRIVDGLEAVKNAAYESVKTALKEQNRGFFQSLGLTEKQINSILQGTSQYERSFGTAVEAAMEKAIRADAFLSKYVEYTANGKVPMGVGKPDWIITTQNSRIPVDVSSAAQAATRLRQLGMWSQRTKWFTEKGLNLTYESAPPRPGK